MSELRWDNDEEGTLEQAARFEQYMLWSDLAIATQRVRGVGNWSMECEGLAARIVSLAKHVGPVPWDYIQIPLVRSGVYQRVFDQAGIIAPPVEWERLARAEERL